ncbi:gamma-glutamyl-gamma-aminobutyrate hydrolase family protein [bacterium]|nr:gamma-glutamyl-gamma-aminobutyrate hydrolase family protein [bacterium]
MSKPLIGINCDHFTDSTGQIDGLRPDYWRAIEHAGGAPVLIPPIGPETVDPVLDRLDAVLLTGGDDIRPERLGMASSPLIHPMTADRDRSDFALIEAIQKRRMPALGICLGCQELNVAHGGTLWLDLDAEYDNHDLKHRDPNNRPGAFHTVEAEDGSVLSHIWGTREGRVNSRHHQAIREVGSGLRVLARSGDGIVEAIQLVDHPFFIAVQWHPENLAGDPLAEKLFEALVKHALK